MAFRLPRLPRNVAIVDPATGFPSLAFQRWWQSVVETLEAQEAAQDAAILAIQQAQAAADAAQDAADAADAAALAAQTAADTANTAASTAQNAADDAASVAALTASGVTGLTLTATDAGADATITISAHTRVYGDGTSVSVNGGTLTGRAYSTLYYVYYDQASRAGGAVTYATTTSQSTAAQTGDRHLVGQVTTPAAAAPDNNGDFVAPPGIGNIYF